MIVDDHRTRIGAEGVIGINAHSSSFAVRVTQHLQRGKCVETE
jgi:hypothetical protein